VIIRLSTENVLRRDPFNHVRPKKQFRYTVCVYEYICDNNGFCHFFTLRAEIGNGISFRKIFEEGPWNGSCYSAEESVPSEAGNGTELSENISFTKTAKIILKMICPHHKRRLF
jgi:hypothetical protein